MNILLISFFFVLCIQNTAVAHAIIRVKNDYSADELEQHALFYADKLGLDSSVNIIISLKSNVSKGIRGYTQYNNASDIGGGHQVLITINQDMKRSEQLHTLAHEMVHAKQFVEGKLVKENGSANYSWKGRYYKKIYKIAHHERPWEKEAHQLGGRLYMAFKQQFPMLAMPKGSDPSADSSYND